MTIYNTAYDTTACANFRMDSIVSAILEARLRDPLNVADGVAYIDASNGASGQIKAFKHALYIHKATNPRDWQGADISPHDPILAMDARAAGRFDATTGRFKVTNSTMYRNLVYRGALSAAWLRGGASAFRSITPLATSVFASWLGEAIGFKYALDPKTKIDLMIIAGIFYQSNHVTGIEFDKGNEQRYIAAIANAIRVPVTDVMKMYAHTQAIVSIEDFCNKVKSVLGNVRLESLNHGVLVSLMGGTWAGDNAIELTAVAMEHPPTWVALVHEAGTNVALKNMGLSKIVGRSHYKDGLDRLKQMLQSLAPESTELIEAAPSLY